MIVIRNEPMFSFGTDGIRGNADQFPFTDQALYALGRALTAWAQQTYKKNNLVVLIGCDTRISCERIKRHLVRGLSLNGVSIVDAGVIPTPAVSQLVSRSLLYDIGIMISASHNPYFDNGVKVFDARNCKISADDEHFISRTAQQFLQEAPEIHDIEFLPEASSISLWDQASHAYQQKVIDCFESGFLRDIKVVLDCAHGATYLVAPQIFRALGAQVHVLGDQPQGTNINAGCGALHPANLAHMVTQLQADCGFAFDGDGDRVVVVNRHGIVKDGDDILAILIALSEFSNVTHIVGTQMTNQGFEHYLSLRGKELIRTKVGDKYISQVLERDNLPLGGEASGHVIIKDYLATGDAIFVALKTLEAIIKTDNWDMHTFQKFPQVAYNVPVVSKKDLAAQPFAQLINEYTRKLEGGRLIVRYSGTENVLRVMAEALDHDCAYQVVHCLAHELQEALKIL